MKKVPLHILCRLLPLLLVLLTIYSCGSVRRLSSVRKLSTLRGEGATASLSLPPSSRLQSLDSALKPKKDTIKVVNMDGHEMFLMSAVKDDDGNMVANQVLDAAVVVARFRNVAERGGKIDLRFQVIVPQALFDKNWQLRYRPTMFIQRDSIQLDSILITGELFRRRQLRGYQHYQRFLDSIITDSTSFIDLRALELFLRRNIPQLYAFRSDSSYVDENDFRSAFGLNQRQVIEHYTNHLAMRYNARRKGMTDKMFRRYVKNPIISEGIRLDTVMRDINGAYVYNYVQTIATRPRLRKVDIVLDGQIYENSGKIYDIPRSEPLTFFISSLSAFVDGAQRFLTKVVERRVSWEDSYNIEFPLGRYAVLPELGDNAREIRKINARLESLLTSEEFTLDSVLVLAACSPEGPLKLNEKLSPLRGNSISDYFNDFIKRRRDSLAAERGFVINVDEQYAEAGHGFDKGAANDASLSAARGAIPAPQEGALRAFEGFRPRHIAENWDFLDRLVEMDSVLTLTQKEEYFAYADITDLDLREASMRRENWYQYLKSSLYPRLRSVQFQFALSRNGVLKDTIHTTVLDSVYMSGVEAIRERDYERAIEILSPYSDYNTAVAYLALDRNLSALSILEKCPDDDRKEYLMAIISSRLSDEQAAVQHYLNACALNPQYVHRGNLDPEISALINKYGLHADEY